MPSDKYTLADAVAVDRLLQPVADWMADRRDEGMTDEQIADAIGTATHGVINVSRNTVNAWIQEGGHPSRAEFNATQNKAAA